MKTCIVCGNQMPEDEMGCGRCGFPAEQRYFLSEKHCRAWQHEIVEPARLSWQRQELERQRRELEMQKRLFAEQRESLKRGKPDIDTANSGWNTDTGKKEKPKKDQQPKKKGDMVKNTLIAFAVFAAAGLIGRAVIAPSSSPSSASFGETQQHIEASIDAETEPVTLSQEQHDKAAGFQTD